MLWLLWIVPLLVVIYIMIQRRRQKFAVRYASLSLVKEAVGRGPGFRRHLPPALFLTGLTVLILAIARPVATVTLPSQEGTVVLAIDVSGSMRADDLNPSRIEAAKEAAKTFVEKQPRAVRIGVVSFSESAAIVQAPTKDRTAALAAINRLAPQSRTAIGSGISTSLDVIFEESDAPRAPSSTDILGGDVQNVTPAPVPRGTYIPAAIVLLSDGQSNTGPAPLDVAETASEHGVRIYTVGMGFPEGTVLKMQGYSMRVRLDEETLKNIAEKTDGSYFKADNEADLQRIYENLGTRLVFKAEQAEITAPFTAAAAVFLLAGVALSLLWFNRLP